MIESAFAAVQKNADENGAKVQTLLVGPVPERVHGSAQHIHQLITTLATSLPDIGRSRALEIEVSFGQNQNGSGNMLLSLLLIPSEGDETLCGRLIRLAQESATLQTLRSKGPELALASAWQLALALGGSPFIETTADRKVRVQISLPLLATLVGASFQE